MPPIDVWLISLALAFGAGTAATLVLARAAGALKLVDHPGGRKSHSQPVPLVGGLAIFVALLGATTVIGIANSAGYFLFALSIVIAVGMWDDVTEISPRVKFAIEIVASCFMIFGAGVQLHSVGDLLGWKPIGLWIFAVPLTVFAVVGVVNSLNMMDGLDGLGGSIALVAFAWYAAVAAVSGLDLQFKTALIFCGAIGGFLLFNLRFPWQPRARVFLGDAGSLMIGFALGWFAIDLTQGARRTMPPIAALWIIVLPLADCVSLMARRIRAGRSPFVADSHHFHHYLLARGFTHGQTLGTLVALSFVFGALGFFGWRLGLPEAALFWPFFIGFFAYHLWIQRAWRAIDSRRPVVPAITEDEKPAIAS
jgi:UDP-GlcNAc:undecaprenyl-phosphate/decaprenyl-phosphate GlcNAc-1-phosphate transferase